MCAYEQSKKGMKFSMIVKMTNKDKGFYEYMGKFFGSRVVERQTNDRIYDDNNKQWYILLEKEEVKAFVSASNNKIKNIYTTDNKYLEKILNKMIKDGGIITSVVTNKYVDVYEKCGLKVSKDNYYKNFVEIYM